MTGCRRIVERRHVAGAARLLGPLVGAGYKRLYARLWDEDEAMMQRRQEVLDTAASRRNGADVDPSSISLGPEAALRASVPRRIDTARGPMRIVEVDGALLAHPTTCPHLGGPLEDAPVIDRTVTCPWHGYRFDVRSGAPVGGHRCRLPPGPRVEVDERTREARLVWDRSRVDREE